MEICVYVYVYVCAVRYYNISSECMNEQIYVYIILCERSKISSSLFHKKQIKVIRFDLIWWNVACKSALIQSLVVDWTQNTN